MKNKIEETRSDYIRIENNPITLLIAIKEHAQNYYENRYYMSINLDSMRTVLTTKQKVGESRSSRLLAYQARDFVWHKMCSSHTLEDP